MRSLPLILAMLAAPAPGSWCEAIDERPLRLMEAQAPATLPPGHLYEITLAIETDASLRELLGSAEDVRSYVRDLVERVGRITKRELSTRIVLGYVSTWSGADPFPEGNIVTRLRGVAQHWQDHRSEIERAAVVMLSGAGEWQGAAFVDALCDRSRGYAIAQGLTGDVDIDAQLVAHELGHTLGSPHSHCYAGIGGSQDPVDACWGQERECYAGPTSLPGIGRLTGGEPGQQTGTLMSYCGYLTNGTAGLDLRDSAPTFGRSHPFGIRAERVPNLMLETLDRTAPEQPGCVRVVPLDLVEPRQIPALGAASVLVLALIMGAIGARRLI
jgi:hypothetical protein